MTAVGVEYANMTYVNLAGVPICLIESKNGEPDPTARAGGEISGHDSGRRLTLPRQTLAWRFHPLQKDGWPFLEAT